MGCLRHAEEIRFWPAASLGAAAVDEKDLGERRLAVFVLWKRSAPDSASAILPSVNRYSCGEARRAVPGASKDRARIRICQNLRAGENDVARGKIHDFSVFHAVLRSGGRRKDCGGNCQPCTEKVLGDVSGAYHDVTSFDGC